MIIKFNSNFKTQVYKELFKNNNLKHPFFILNNKLNIDSSDLEVVQKSFKRLELKFKTL